MTNNNRMSGGIALDLGTAIWLECYEDDDPILKKEKIWRVPNTMIVFTHFKEKGESSSLAWGSKYMTANKWESIETELMTNYLSTPEEPEVPEKDSIPKDPKVNIRESSTKGLYVAELNSDAIDTIIATSEVISKIDPQLGSATEAIGLGLKLIDMLGGGKGVKIYTLPIFPIVAIAVPKDPKEFGENLFKAVFNPKVQYEVVSGVLGNPIQSVKEKVNDPWLLAVEVALPRAVMDPKKLKTSILKSITEPNKIYERTEKAVRKAGRDVEKVGKKVEKAVKKILPF